MPIKKHNITIKKKHEGGIIYAFPTGDNYNRHNNELITVKVVKVRIKYAELKLGDSSVDYYCINTGATQAAVNTDYSMNGGYLWYESVEDYEKDNAGKTDGD